MKAKGSEVPAGARWSRMCVQSIAPRARGNPWPLADDLAYSAQKYSKVSCCRRLPMGGSPNDPWEASRMQLQTMSVQRTTLLSEHPNCDAVVRTEFPEACHSPFWLSHISIDIWLNQNGLWHVGIFFGCQNFGSVFWQCLSKSIVGKIDNVP